MSYLTLYIILGVCLALLALVGHRLYRQHMADVRHNGSLRRSRKFFGRSHSHK